MRKVVLTASGGGHTGYAVALAQRLVGKAEMFFLVPEGDTWTEAKVRGLGRVAWTKKARGPTDPLWKALPGLLMAGWQGLRTIPGDYEVFVSSGSNHSVPPALAAKAKGLKLVNVESSVRFTRASLSALALKPISDLTVLQWPEQEEILPGGVVVGPLYELPAYEPRDEGYILITGGTYGHKALFEAASELDLDNVVLQTGRLDPGPYKVKHPDWVVFRFDPDFGRWLAGASVVVSHLGKTVIDAALSYRKPVVIAPNPEWRHTAGWEDAEILAEKLNAVLLEELSPEALRSAIEEARGRRPPRYRDGAGELAKIILEEL